MNAHRRSLRRLFLYFAWMAAAGMSVAQISVVPPRSLAGVNGVRPNEQTGAAASSLDVSNVGSAIAALEGSSGDGRLDFRLSSAPLSGGAPGLCVEGGKAGAGLSGAGSCVAWPQAASSFAYIGSAQSGGASQIFLEDATANAVYVLTGSGAQAADAASLPGSRGQRVDLPQGVRAGSLTTSDLNGDGRADLIYAVDGSDPSFP